MGQALQLTADGAATDRVRIIATLGNAAPITYDVAPESTVIVGRNPTCGIVLESENVGPMQCMFAFHSGELELQPWPTASGTVLNGVDVDSRAPLKSGDVIELGEYRLTVECGPDVGQRAGSFEPAETQQATQQVNQQPAVEPAPETTPAEAPAPANEARKPDTHAAVPAPSEPEPVTQSAASEDRAETTEEETQPAAPVPPATRNSTPREFTPTVPNFKWDDDDEDDETVALLKAEILELQTELSERDSQLEELLAGDLDFAAAPEADSDDNEGALVARVDELLLELSESDERLSLLQTMLAASETANRAEQEERRQLEGWVGDIERRISENDAVRIAEIDVLRRRAEQLQEERDQAEKRLESSAKSNSANREHDNLLQQLRQDNSELQGKLEQAEAEKQSLQQQLDSAEHRSTEEAQQLVVDRAIREERAEIAKQQAELARARAELTSKLAEIDRDDDNKGKPGRVDDRVRALREHLKEIHLQESEERDQGGGLMSRIAGLWNSLDR